MAFGDVATMRSLMRSRPHWESARVIDEAPTWVREAGFELEPGTTPVTTTIDFGVVAEGQVQAVRVLAEVRPGDVARMHARVRTSANEEIARGLQQHGDVQSMLLGLSERILRGVSDVHRRFLVRTRGRDHKMVEREDADAPIPA